MADSVAERLEKMLAQGNDSSALRFGLGNAYLADAPADAVRHLRKAVELDPEYSAAWKLLGKALTAIDDPAGAAAAYEAGIAAAEAKGDMQAAREMQVFLKRLSSAR